MNQLFDTTKTYLLINKHNNEALEAPNVNNYNKNSLQLGPINENNKEQMWIVEHKEKNLYEIILGFPDKILTAEGTDVTLKTGSGDKGHQYWELDTSNPNGIKISQYKHEGCYLCMENRRLIIRKKPAANMIDLWEFRVVTKNVDLNRCCYIRSTINNKLFDVPASEGKEGVQICIWDANYRFNQRWKIYRAGEVFIIKSLKTDLNLDIDGERYAHGTKVIQYHSTGGNNQFWKFEEKSPNIYRICSWYDPSLEIGTDGKNLTINKGQKFMWKIEGHIPEL